MPASSLAPCEAKAANSLLVIPSKPFAFEISLPSEMPNRYSAQWILGRVRRPHLTLHKSEHVIHDYTVRFHIFIIIKKNKKHSLGT